MSVQSEIERIEQNIANTYSVLNDMGATIPEVKNSENLANTARTVPQGSGGEAVQEIEYVHCTLDAATLSIIDISHTNQQLRNLINANKYIVVICSTPFGPVYGSLAHMDISSNDVQFSIMMYANFGQGLNLYYFHVFVHSNDTVELAIKLVSLIG
jgi:hypothetical protein